MTTPSGKLAWGQPGNYDAFDDRAVITAVTRGRLGLVWPVDAVAGTGLNIVLRGGWLGVASCGDQTSAVVGTREEQMIQASPGPGTGSREDVLWCDTDPDAATWELRVIPAAQIAGRHGIPLVNITVPAGANLASQMTLRPVDASIERRLMSHTAMAVYGSGSQRDYTATGWGLAVGRGVESGPVWIERGQWYRVTYVCPMVSVVGSPGSLEGRIGIGERPLGQDASQSVLRRAGVISFVRLGVPVIAIQSYVFRHSLSAASLWRVFDGRVWTSGTATIRPGGFTDLGPEVQWLDVEDIGS